MLITLADNFACKPIAPMKLQSSRDAQVSATRIRNVQKDDTAVPEKSQ